MKIAEVKGLTKRFEDCLAVDSADFYVKKGEIFGFLGPNGAGKTTTINMLTGLTRPTLGNITINGMDGIRDIKKVQGLIGIVPDESNLYEEMDGFDNLSFCASLYGIEKTVREKRAGELLEEFGLADTGKRTFKQYSKGMKRKLTIAAGIIHEPEILFLDEPTTGIDVESARHIRVLIRELNQKGTTIFLTTHYIEEAERLCDRIGFIVSGRILRIGSLEELMNENQKQNIIQFKVDFSLNSLKEELFEKFSSYTVIMLDDRSFSVHSSGKIHLLPFIKFLDERNIGVLEAKMVRPSLEDVFVRVTGIGIDRMKKEKEGKKKK